MFSAFKACYYGKSNEKAFTLAKLQTNNLNKIHENPNCESTKNSSLTREKRQYKGKKRKYD